MKVDIKLVDNTLPMPVYHTEGAVAFDMYSRLDMEIPPFTPTIVPSNLIVKIPEGYALLIIARSSLPKKNLMVGNGIGIIDQDYCGENDEIGMWMVNISKEQVKIEKGMRLCQGMFVRIDKVDFLQVKQMSHKSRGGFGSTGQK